MNNMANIFITYGDDNFKESLIRLKKQARLLGIFEKVIAYTPKDLPLYIKSSPLFAYKKGGGYWIWKPYIIYHTLQNCKKGDVVYYADAGCSINPESLEWQYFDELMKEYSAIFFQYRSNYDYGWKRFCTFPQNNSTAIKHWTKPLTIEFFANYFCDKQFLDYDKIWGGFCIVKKENVINPVIDEWLKLSLFYPELLVDPLGIESEHLPKAFNLHRHDQSIITPLIYYYKDKCKIKVLFETSESDKNHAAIIAERYRVGKMPFVLYVKYKIYNIIHRR